jgi:hypothetical protein
MPACTASGVRLRLGEAGGSLGPCTPTGKTDYLISARIRIQRTDYIYLDWDIHELIIAPELDAGGVPRKLPDGASDPAAAGSASS